MTRWLLVLLLFLPVPGGAQPLLDFRNDLAFKTEVVEGVAGRIYTQKLRLLEADGKLDNDIDLLERLNDILGQLRVAAEYELPAAAAIRWEVHICSRCGESASAMAGGRLLFGEEFIATLAPTDDELAFMMAHEMAHVLAEHTREYATTARFFVANGLHREYWDIQRELDESIVVNLRMAHEYERQELDADFIGFILGGRAGYQPEAMLSLLRKLGADEPSFLSRHPEEIQRMRQAQTMLESVRWIYMRSTGRLH